MAAGSGSRMGGQLPKQYLPIFNNLNSLQLSILSFLLHHEIDSITVVIDPLHFEYYNQSCNQISTTLKASDCYHIRCKITPNLPYLQSILTQQNNPGQEAQSQAAHSGANVTENSFDLNSAAIITKLVCQKLLPAVTGGYSRQHSVHLGLKSLAEINPRHVLIHDAARPLVCAQLISRVIASLKAGNNAVDVAIPVTDTIKSRDTKTIIDRNSIYRTQTPQGFKYSLIRDLHNQFTTQPFSQDGNSAAIPHQRSSTPQTASLDFNNESKVKPSLNPIVQSSALSQVTDDIGLCIAANTPYDIVPGSEDNFKLTSASDLLYLRFLLQQQYVT